MARASAPLTVRTTPGAAKDLAAIWVWNADYYGPKHAAAYVKFLEIQTDRLATRHAKGRRVPEFLDYQYVTFRKSRARHGHVCVYWVRDGAVEVLHYFHTAQNWHHDLTAQ